MAAIVTISTIETNDGRTHKVNCEDGRDLSGAAMEENAMRNVADNSQAGQTTTATGAKYTCREQ